MKQKAPLTPDFMSRALLAQFGSFVLNRGSLAHNLIAIRVERARLKFVEMQGL